jgi:large subunit ribosomal protein L22
MSARSVSTQEFSARHRYARITARKARLVADAIRGLSVNRALETLAYAPQRAAVFYLKLVRSAMANASQDEGVDVNRLVITDCRADDGPMLQNRMRWRPGPQGRALPFKKLTSHLTVKVREAAEDGPSRRRGSGPEEA